MVRTWPPPRRSGTPPWDAGLSVPEQLLADAVRAVSTDWGPAKALPALLDPARSAELSTDLAFGIKGDRAQPVDGKPTGFTGQVLRSTVTRRPGSPTTRRPAIRAGPRCPARWPRSGTGWPTRDLLLDLGQYVSLPAFRQVAGTPSETGPGWERYGAIVLATHDSQPSPALRPDLLDADGTDPYLPALRGDAAKPYPMEVALRLARDPRFAALLGDPGEPGGGARATDGTWWPQDPTRSVPDLVAEVAGEYGLGADAAAVYLMLLAMPDPTDRNIGEVDRLEAGPAEGGPRRTGRHRPGRRGQPAPGRPLAVPARPLAGARQRRSCRWSGGRLALFDPHRTVRPGSALTVPFEPVADLYRRAWQRLRDGDRPRFDELMPTARTPPPLSRPPVRHSRETIEEHP